MAGRQRCIKQLRAEVSGRQEQLHHDAAKLQPVLAGANEGLGRLHGRGELSARMVLEPWHHHHNRVSNAVRRLKVA